MSTYALFDGGIAALAHDVDGGTRVHGVVIGEGDITQGLSGKRTRWPEEVLEDMVGMLEGKPITMADSLDPEQHVGIEVTEDGAQVTSNVSMDEKVGEITRDAFEEGVGLLFEGFLADFEAEDVVERGLAQVSPVLFRELELVEGEEDDGNALYEPSEVSAFRDLALVADGAAPSNEINVGASSTMPPAAAEALITHFGSDTGVDAGAAGESAINQPGGDDGPNDSNSGEGQSTPASGWRKSMTEDDLTDKERELLALAGQKDDPTVVEADVLERLELLDEHEELLDEAADLEDPTVESEEQLAAMRERINVVEDMMAEALTERKSLREATVEAMSFEAMASEFETDDGELDVEALSQSPESGSGPTGGGSNGPSEDDVERIEEIEQKLSTVGGTLPDSRVEALRDEAADLAGAEDYDGALEVL